MAKKKNKKVKSIKFNKILAAIFLIIVFVLGGFILVTKQSNNISTKIIKKTERFNGVILRKVVKIYKNGNIRQYAFFAGDKKIAVQNFRKDGSYSMTYGKIPNGLVREFYENGRLKAEANYLNNKRQGIEQVFYQSGPLLAVLYYEKEKLFPRADVYNEDGTLYSRWRYNQESKNGLALFYFRDGRVAVQSACNNGKHFFNLLDTIQIQG